MADEIGTPTPEVDLMDYLNRARVRWLFHLNDWAFPIYLRFAHYKFATYCCVQFLCFSVTYRSKDRV